MNRRLMKTVLTTLMVGFVSMGTASAAPIVVGTWTWTDLGELDFIPLGSEFAVTNSSQAPLQHPSLDPLAPGQGWQPGDFTNIVVTLTPVGACPVLVDCSVTIADIGAGSVDVNLDFVDTLAVASATLSLDFLGQTLTSTISAVGGGGLLIYDFTPAQVPEPAGLALVSLGSAAWLATRRQRRR